MVRFLVQRFGQAILTVWLMSVVVFFMARLTGSPLDFFLSPYATEEQFAARAAELGLNRSLLYQYGAFITDALKGDFGESLYFREPALNVVVSHLPATVVLAVVALVFAVVVAIPLGVLAAAKPGGASDHFGRVIALGGQAVPNFWLGIILIEVFAVQLGWFPTSGNNGLAYLVLPAITMSAYLLAGLLRLTRSAMRDAMTRDFMVFAAVKGASRRRLIWMHALRSALVPVVTFAGLVFAQLIVGSIVVETVFSWPGVGSLAYQAALQRDFPLLQAVVITFTIAFVALSLIVDVIYSILEPRVRR